MLTGSARLVTLFALLTLGCVTATAASDIPSPPVISAAGQNSCPAPGTRVPFAKVKALPQVFVGCDVETEVSFVATGWGNQICVEAPADDKASFQIAEPGGAPQSTPFGTFGYMGLIQKSAGDLIFEAKAGDRLVLRGGTHFSQYQGQAAGVGSSCFVATSVRKANH